MVQVNVTDPKLLPDFSTPGGLSIKQNGSEIWFASKLSSAATTWNPKWQLSLFDFEVVTFQIDCGRNKIGDNTTLWRNCYKQNRTMFAFQASLTPCVYHYSNVSITNSVLYESIAEPTLLYLTFGRSWAGYMFSLAGNLPAFPDVDCQGTRTPDQNHTVPTTLLSSARLADVKNMSNIPAPEGVRYVNIETQRTNESDVLYYNANCTYQFGWHSITAINNFVTRLFGSTTAPKMLSSMPSGDPAMANGEAWLEKLFSNGTTTLNSARAFVDGLAHSMTSTMRQNGDGSFGNNAAAVGAVLVNETCVSVQWPWLILPIVLLAANMVFFVATVVKYCANVRPGTVGEARRPWKSSSLPLLWTGVPAAVKERYGTLDDTDAMKQCADQTRVILRRDNRLDGIKPVGKWGLTEIPPGI